MTYRLQPRLGYFRGVPAPRRAQERVRLGTGPERPRAQGDEARLRVLGRVVARAGGEDGLFYGFEVRGGHKEDEFVTLDGGGHFYLWGAVWRVGRGREMMMGFVFVVARLVVVMPFEDITTEYSACSDRDLIALPR